VQSRSHPSRRGEPHRQQLITKRGGASAPPFSSRRHAMRINYRPKEGKWIAFRPDRRETMNLMLSGFQLDASGRLQTDRPDIAARFFTKCCPFGQDAIRQHRIAAREAEKEAVLLVITSDDRREIEEKLQAIRPEKQQGKLLVHIGERGR